MGRKRILGLDVSLNSTGVVVGTTKAKILLDSTISPKVVGFDRLRYTRDALTKIVSDYEVSTALIENYAFGARNQAHQIGEMGGVVRLALYELGVQITLVPPGTLKKYVTGSGSATKDVMLLHVYKKWQYSTNKNDIADAYALYRLGLEMQTSTTKTMNELKKKLKILEVMK